MTLSRRSFLFSAGAAGLGLSAGALPSQGRVLLRFGALSDSHISSDAETLEPLRRIFAWFASENVDAVCHAGDVCEVGSLTELQSVAQVWKAAFPGGCNAEGGRVQPVFAFGNHDYHAASYQNGKALSDAEKGDSILFNKAKAWQIITGESSFPGEVCSYEVKGYTFLISHWGAEDGIGEWFKTHSETSGKPIFHIRHSHPKSTCYGPWATGIGRGCKTLMAHPNVFVLSGHSHINLGNDCGLWQGGFVSMGCGSARIPALGGFEGKYDNVPVKSIQNRHWHTQPPKGKAWQASLITVYEHEITIERRDFFFEPKGESIGSMWTLGFPFQHDAKHPYAIANSALPPQFPAKAKVSIRKGKGRRRPENEVENQIVFSVSASALSDGEYSRACFYRFDVCSEDNRVIVSRSVVQDGWMNAEARCVKKSVICAFAEEELPQGVSVKVRVTPMNAVLREGRPLEAGPFAL